MCSLVAVSRSRLSGYWRFSREELNLVAVLGFPKDLDPTTVKKKKVVRGKTFFAGAQPVASS